MVKQSSDEDKGEVQEAKRERKIVQVRARRALGGHDATAVIMVTTVDGMTTVRRMDVATAFQVMRP